MLDMQTDGNLVLYGQHSVLAPRLALWASNTLGGTEHFMAMQADGNFVMYTPTFQPVCPALAPSSLCGRRLHPSSRPMDDPE